MGSLGIVVITSGLIFCLLMIHILVTKVNELEARIDGLEHLVDDLVNKEVFKQLHNDDRETL